MGFESEAGIVWDIRISDIAPASYIADGDLDREFVCNDFRLSYKGTGDDILDPIKSSSLKFNVVIEGNIDRNKIDDIFDTNFDTNWYVSLWKDEVIYWHGYLSPMTSRKPNKGFPYDYSLEALDALALLKNQKIFSKANTIAVNVPYWGLDLLVPKHRFGGDRNIQFTNNKTLYPNNESTVIELVYSLLFDLDVDTIGELKSMMFWDTATRQAPVPNSGELGHTILHSWWFLFQDAIPNPAIGYPIEPIEDVTAHHILQKVMKLLCCRIFQKGGSYYIVQPEAYETLFTRNVYHHKKGPSSAFGNHPVFDQKTTLSSSDYLTPINSIAPRKDIMEGSTWGKVKNVHTTSLKYPWSSWLWNTKPFRKTFMNVNTSTNNLSDLSIVEDDQETVIPTEAWVFAGTVGSIYSHGAERLWDRQSGAFKTHRTNTYSANVRARAELKNKARDEFSGTLISTDYDFFHGITYEGKNYIPHTMDLHGRDDFYKCRWLEAKVETGGLGELTNEDSDE